MAERAAEIEGTGGLKRPLGELADPLPIPVLKGARAFDVSIRPPGSKSITNRALLLAALAQGTSELRGALTDADDAQVMLRAIERLGARVEFRPARGPDEPNLLRITGVGGQWRVPEGKIAHLNLNNAGTATRFLAAAAILPTTEDANPGLHRMLGTPLRGLIEIDGDARMRERPIAELVGALRSIGAHVEHVGREGYPPIRVWPLGLSRFDLTVHFEPTSSSQFISAIMLIAPWLVGGVTITFNAYQPITSEPYVDMTLGLLKRLGAPVHDQRPHGVHVGPVADMDERPLPDRGPGIKPFRLEIEPDASGATYFEAAALLAPHGGRCTIEGLDLHPSRPSLQGDTQFVSVITAAGGKVERLNRALRVIGSRDGTITPFDVDLADMPDTAMTAAVLAACASPTPTNPTATSVLHGLRTLRVKETDRLAALKTELEKVGAKVEIFKETFRGVADEGLRITASAELAKLGDERHDLAESGKIVARVEFDTYKDHRMAMALALIGLRRPNVWIRDPKCVAKTYPTFFAELARLYERTV